MTANTPRSFFNLVGLYSQAHDVAYVLEAIASNLSKQPSGRLFAWTSDLAGSEAEEIPIRELETGKVWQRLRGKDQGFVAVPTGRGAPRLNGTEKMWAAIAMNQQYSQTRSLSTSCNMLQFSIESSACGLRSEQSIRRFVCDSMRVVGSVGTLIGAFCTIADPSMEMGGHLYDTLCPSPPLQPFIVLREQLILGLSEGHFWPPQHAVALCVPYSSASARARAIHRSAPNFVFSEVRGKTRSPCFRSGRVGENIHCDIASDIGYLVRRPLNSGCIDHARESVLMRRWLLDK